jgi:hypothetical protein
MTTNAPAVPASHQSAGWAPWVTLATLRASGGEDTAASHEDVGAALASLVGANSVGANTVPAGAFYARKAGWMSSPKRGQHAVTAAGVAALAGFGFAVGDVPVPVVEEPVIEEPVEEPTPAPVVEEIAKAAEIIAFPTPTPEPVIGESDPYAGADDYIVGLAAAATPCFGSWSARAKTTCGKCPLAVRCAASASTRAAEIAILIEREEAEAIRLAAEAEARAVREAAKAEEDRLRAEREAEDAARWAAEADEARRKVEAAAIESIFDAPTATPSNTGTGTSAGLANILASMAASAPAPTTTVPVAGGTPIKVAFDAVCAGCRTIIPRDEVAVSFVGRGLFHTACAHTA